MCLPANQAGLNFVRLATPTTDARRLPGVLANTSGFLYYVSSNGVTGGAAPSAERVKQELDRIRTHSDIPVAVGFGIRTAAQAKEIGAFADGVVVGTALVNQIAGSLTADGKAGKDTVDAVSTFVKGLSSGVRDARLAAAE